MPQPVLNADRTGRQPFANHRRVDIIVVAPAFVAGVVGRVNEDTVHLARILGQERLERVQIVPVHDQVAVKGNRTDSPACIGHQRAERHREVVVVDKFLALEIYLGHARPW